MSDLKQFTCSQFEDSLNQTFVIQMETGKMLKVILIEATPKVCGDIKKAHHFSLVFRGAMEPVLEQRIYTLENDNLGSLEIFMVPIGPDNSGMCYEAVFA